MSKPRRHRALVIFAIILGGVGFLLLLAQDQETLRVRSAIAAEDPRSSAYFAALVGSDLSRGNGYDVLTNGDQIFPPMLEAIDNAKRRISFETYVYETSEIGDRFTARSRKRRGAA